MAWNQIPTVVEETSRGERAFDIYSRLLGQRIVFLGTAIDDQVANLVVAQLIHLDGEDSTRPINLYVNSPGGEMSSMMAIYDTMQHVSAPVATLCIGMAASAAAVILAGGAPGRRSALPHSRVMIHQPLVPHGMQGQASDLEIQAREIVRMREQMTELLARHTGRSADEIRIDTERDHWLPAEEARAYGIVDRVLERAEQPVPVAVG